MSDDERRKKSWKEIDRARDGSGGRGDERRGDERRQRGGRSQKSYRAALDRLFNSGKIGELVEERSGAEQSSESEAAVKLLRAIRQAEDPASITKAVDAYVAEHELPDDPEILGKVLQHKKPSMQLEGMQRLQRALQHEKPRRTRALVGQLKLIRDTAGDPEMEQLARELLDVVE